MQSDDSGETLRRSLRIGQGYPHDAFTLPAASTTRARKSETGRFVAAFSRRQRFVLAGLTGAWALGASVLLRWLWQPAHVSTTLGMLITSTLVVFDVVVLPGWFLFFVWRARRLRSGMPGPSLRTAIVVTKAPSEPWPMVRATLAGALAQQFPAADDVWLADEDPAPETRSWCATNGVRVITRRGVRVYQREDWPRRRRCKEGNLAFFYDCIGYVSYDVVVQLDADHVPAPDYLLHMLAPFADPEVGYVAAPSVCDSNAASSWAARGRLYSEAVLHGAYQSGCSGDWAPSCIGSHYAVRTLALQAIGGLGPELAEDFSTTLLMNAAGWRGVFALDAEAHGQGPVCLADCLTQELQWARSMMNILLRHIGPYWKRLSRHAQLRLGFCLLWYPLIGTVMAASLLLPGVALLTHTPLIRVSLPSFFLHLAPVVVVMVGATMWLGGQGLLRPAGSHALSWEVILFQLVRWPWALLGCGQAILGRECDFKVTPKQSSGAMHHLPTRFVLPYLILALVSLLPALLVSHAGAARGYYFWSLFNAVLYLLVAVVVLGLHAWENRAPGWSWTRREIMPKLPGVALVLTAVTLATIAHRADALQAFDQLAATSPAQRLAPISPATAENASVLLGVTTRALLRNTSFPWQGADLAEVNAFEHHAHKHAGVVMWYVDWAHGRFNGAQLGAIAARGSVPEITWEPWDPTVGPLRPQPLYTLRAIYSGRYDAYIRSWGRGLKRFGHPVRLRFAQEMNADFYPWGKTNSNQPGDFVKAWRHVHDLVQAPNVKWVWSPLAGPLDVSEYPGDAYVDIIGLSGFNGGNVLPWGGWRSFQRIFGDSVQFLHRLHPNKPVEISETSSAEQGGSKAQWIRAMFGALRRYPEITELTWFDGRKEADWRIESSISAMRAFAAGLTDPRFGGPRALGGRDCRPGSRAGPAPRAGAGAICAHGRSA